MFKPTHSKVIIAAMGILGLLQYIKQCLRERHLGDYRGQTAAVDTYAWYLSAYLGCIRSSKDHPDVSLSSAGPIDIALSMTVSRGLPRSRVWGSR